MSDTLHDKKCELVVLTAPSLVCKCKQRELERDLSAAQDTRIREGIEVEKMLCDVLGRPWAASGFSIETLILDIKAELAELKGRAR